MNARRDIRKALRMKIAAIYARVSSDRQKEECTIASQTASLMEYAEKEGYTIPEEWVVQDEGYSGAVLVRPGLERLRDLAAEGQIETLLIYSPDRLSRKYAYQAYIPHFAEVILRIFLLYDHRPSSVRRWVHPQKAQELLLQGRKLDRERYRFSRPFDLVPGNIAEHLQQPCGRRCLG